MLDRKAKVFVSCGQRPNEFKIAKEIENLLRSEGFNPYIAKKIMSLDDIMKITEELGSSDYYLFIDFIRNRDTIPISLFTHQELALARQMGFNREVIILKHNNAPLEGFLRYIQSNPETFYNKRDLLNKLKHLLCDEKVWNPNFCRHFTINNLEHETISYGDHTGDYIQHVWTVEIENRRPDAAATDTICILDNINNNQTNKTIKSQDRTYLKWAGQKSYDMIILPKSSARVAIFYLNPTKPGIFLNSLADISPRKEIIKDDGFYSLYYKIFSPGFPLFEFQIDVNLQWVSPNNNEWPLLTTANLVPKILSTYQ